MGLVTNEIATATVYGTVWLALLCYPAGLYGLIAGSARSRAATRWIWTVGCGAFLVHTITAFGGFYQWSHDVALAETAKQTEALTGVASGFGFYLNVLFAVLWCVDAWWWWTRPTQYLGRSTPSVLWFHGFFLFMILNGAVVFVDSPRRWLGLAIFLVSSTFLGQVLRKPKGP